MSTTLTVNQSISGKVTTTPALNPQTLNLTKPNASKSFSNGTGASQLNQVCTQQLVIPASGTDSINLNTGAVTGSQTITLKTPDNITLALVVGLKVLQAELLTGGSTSVTFQPGGANPFVAGPVSTWKQDIVGAAGGEINLVRTDAAGWLVDATHCNLSVVNNDASNAATINLCLAGA